MQYQLAREQFEFRDIPDNLRAKLEQEYEQFQQLLRDWNATRQQWLEAREKRLQETLAQWERMELRDSYKELKFALKIQRKRWHEVLRSLRSAVATAA
jgi:stearoyl-CoA desaturase (delta-9 desaturase)